MVNTHSNVSAFEGVPPASGAGERIPGGPLYLPHKVLALAEQGEGVLIPWTRKCKDDLMRLSLDNADALGLVCEALRNGRFRNSEWCVQKPNGPWAACDAYRLFRREWVAVAHKEMMFEYFIKFAIGKTGKLLLLVSCHEPQDRG